MDKGYGKIIRTRPIYKTVMNVSDKKSEQQKHETRNIQIKLSDTEQQRTYKTYKQNKMNITTNNQKKKYIRQKQNTEMNISDKSAEKNKHIRQKQNNEHFRQKQNRTAKNILDK